MTPARRWPSCRSRLAALGLFKGKVDGVFGKDLQAAVTKYQQSKGLPADGEVGPGQRRRSVPASRLRRRLSCPPGRYFP